MTAPTPFFLLSQNRRLSARELERAVRLLGEVRVLTDNREQFVAANNLDPDFCLPRGNFAAGADPETGPVASYRRAGRAFEENPQRLQTLRFHTGDFTGFSILNGKRADKLGAGDNLTCEAPPDFDQTLPALISRYDFLPRWQYLMLHTPLTQVFAPPPICGEVGWDYAGIIVNHDTLAYQERVTLLHHFGVFKFLDQIIAKRGFARVLEIGGGYGALGCHIKRVRPQVAYTICDLPEAMYLSAPYVSFLHPELSIRFVTTPDADTDALDGFYFMPNYALPLAVVGRRYDLVLNTLSLSELSAHQICRYAETISQLIGGDGAFFEQNFDNSSDGMEDCKKYLPRYFLRRTSGKPDSMVLIQGTPDLWSNGRWDGLGPTGR